MAMDPSQMSEQMRSAASSVGKSLNQGAVGLETSFSTSAAALGNVMKPPSIGGLPFIKAGKGGKGGP